MPCRSQSRASCLVHGRHPRGPGGALQRAGIEYIVKHGQDDAPPSPTSFSARELAPFLACTVTTSDWQDYLVAAKSDKKKLFGREGLVPATDPLRQSYERLFADSLTTKQMWRTAGGWCCT